MKININKFLQLYNAKDIIFPAAVARYFNLSIKEAYELCENRINEIKDIKKLYILRCPYCSRMAKERYYSIESILQDEETCIECGHVYTPQFEDACVYYEKI